MPIKNVVRRREAGRAASARYAAKKRRARETAAAERAALRQPPSTSDCLWAAGLFEGEGTVTIGSSGRRGYTRPYVNLTSTDPEIVAFFHDRWPGYVRTFTPSPRARQAQTWSLNSRVAITEFLSDIAPHIRTTRVRAKIELVLADCAARVQGSRDPRYRADCLLRMAAIRALNKRGATA